MKNNALLQTIAGAVITTGFTLTGTAVLQKYQNDAAERTRFLDGAQVTAQTTAKLLIQGYNALEQLRDATHKKGFEFYIQNSGQEYENFYRDWRQQMIQNQFSVSRYFGGELASELIHVDEIDKTPVDNMSSPNPCTAPGKPESFDINKMTVQVDCFIRFSALIQDRINSDEPNEKAAFIDNISRKSAMDLDVRKMIDNYEVSYVKVLRSLDDKFTQLGALKVTVVPRE